MNASELTASLIKKMMLPSSPKVVEPIPDWLGCRGRQLTIGLMGEDLPYISLIENDGEICLDGLKEWIEEQGVPTGSPSFFISAHEDYKKLSFSECVSIYFTTAHNPPTEAIVLSVLTGDTGLWRHQPFCMSNKIDDWSKHIESIEKVRHRGAITEWEYSPKDEAWIPKAN